MASQKFSWVSLPQEIRLIILEALVEHEGCMTRYSTVCREWQQIVERKNFSRLKLTVPRIPKFSDIVCQRRRLVKYIWLCIELQEYDCSMCDEFETNEWYEINTTIITRVMTQLFSVLSSWEPTGNLLLDISIHSPSDSRHRYKKLYFSSDAFSEPDDQQEATNPHDPRHGWIEGELVCRSPIPSLERLFEDIEMEESSFWEKLLKVEAVTSLLLRRQTRRRWAAPALYELLDHLPRLQEIYYEPWREWYSMDQRLTDESKSSRDVFVMNKFMLIPIFLQIPSGYLNQSSPTKSGEWCYLKTSMTITSLCFRDYIGFSIQSLFERQVLL